MREYGTPKGQEQMDLLEPSLPGRFVLDNVPFHMPMVHGCKLRQGCPAFES